MLKHVQVSPQRSRADSVSISSTASLCSLTEPLHSRAPSYSSLSENSGQVKISPSRYLHDAIAPTTIDTSQKMIHAPVKLCRFTTVRYVIVMTAIWSCEVCRGSSRKFIKFSKSIIVNYR